MDKSWINKPRLSEDYRLGVANFLDFAFGKSNAVMMKCPCNRCSLAKLLASPHTRPTFEHPRYPNFWHLSTNKKSREKNQNQSVFIKQQEAIYIAH